MDIKFALKNHVYKIDLRDRFNFDFWLYEGLSVRFRTTGLQTPISARTKAALAAAKAKGVLGAAGPANLK